MDEQENKIPSFITNHVDYKAQTIWSFNLLYKKAASGELDGISTTSKVSLITPQGMVIGNIDDVYISQEEYSSLAKNDPERFMAKVAISARNNNLVELEKSNENLSVINDSCIITIRNAKLIPWSGTNKFNFAVLYLFSSDISGFSIGDMQDD